MKRKLEGGIDSVRVINLPMGMKNGGDLSVPPPKSINPPVYFNEGGNVNSLGPRFDEIKMEEEIRKRQSFNIPGFSQGGGIMGFPSPNFSQENTLKPAGVLLITKSYDI